MNGADTRQKTEKGVRAIFRKYRDGVRHAISGKLL
jgi:hypothetical protein